MKKKSNSYKKRTFSFLLFLVFGLLIIIFILNILLIGLKLFNKDDSITNDVVPILPHDTVNKLSLIMVGDSLIHSAVYADADTGNGYDFNQMFSNVKDYISSFDLEFYNQESILGGSSLGLSTYPRFNSPIEVGDAFRNMGFNLVSLANNHTLDRGEVAIINSKNYWNSFNDIVTAGSYSSQEDKENIKIIEKNGITYALLAYTDTTNGLSVPSGKDYLVNIYSEENVRKDVESIRSKVDLLMVSIHFGVEYQHNPNTRQREIASYLSDLGVDIVIGHHPHVVEPIEFINNTMVIYSLGNFISAQRGTEKLTGLMASVDVVKTTNDGNSKLTLENPTAELVYTYSDYSKGYRSNFRVYRYKDLTDDILPNHDYYQNYFLDIVTNGDTNIIRK